MRALALVVGASAALAAGCGGVNTAAPLPPPSLPASPPHGHWLLQAGNPVLVCDLGYYPTSTTCLQPQLFARTANTTDRLPPAILSVTTRPLLSRRIETVRSPSGRVWQLFLAVENRREDPTGDPCLEVSDASLYLGGLCLSGSELVSQTVGADWLIEAGVLVGFATDATRQVRILDAGGHPHPVHFAAGGFLYFCPGSCTCHISAVEALASGQPATVDDLRDPRTHRLYWCRR